MKLLRIMIDIIDSDKLSRIEKIKEITSTILFVFVCLLAIGLTIYIAIR